jgi:hypothetical protein
LQLVLIWNPVSESNWIRIQGGKKSPKKKQDKKSYLKSWMILLAGWRLLLLRGSPKGNKQFFAFFGEKNKKPPGLDLDGIWIRNSFTYKLGRIFFTI